MIEKPPPPPSRFILKGLLNIPIHPQWMRREHYQTPCGVAISDDLSETYPTKLNAKQRVAVEKVKELARRYGNQG